MTMTDGIDKVAPWMQTTSGIRVNLLDPQPDDFVLEDICTSLERLNRFVGHGTSTPWSVAKHSCFVGWLTAYDPEGHEFDLGDRDKLILTGLLHDAEEAFIGDLSSPVKQAIRHLSGDNQPTWSGADELASRIRRAIGRKFDLFDPIPKVVKNADLKALAYEAEFTFGEGTAESWGLGHLLDPHINGKDFCYCPGDLLKTIREISSLELV